MARKLTLGTLRDWVIQAPALAFYWLFSWMFSTRILRCKAAATPYPLVRSFLLRRSGVSLGSQVYLGFGVTLVGTARRICPLTIRDRAAVAPYVCFVTSSYPADSRLSKHPQLRDAVKRLGPIVVEEDVWIGAGAKILPGVTIGRGSVVGAGAVVVRDVPPATVVAGVPAKVIRHLDQTGEPDGQAVPAMAKGAGNP